MRINKIPAICSLLILATAIRAQTPPPGSIREYRDFAMIHEGNAARGRELFNDEKRAACVKCHSVDGSSGKAGPNLFAIGEKLPRPDLITAVLAPSAAIAVGYGTTIVELKSGEEVSGIIKEAGADTLDLAGADGKHIRIPTGEIKGRRASTVSLMPEGLQAGMSHEESTDLIDYLITLQPPENALTSNRGMPADIPELPKPIGFRPFLSGLIRFPADFVPPPGELQNGLVWFGQMPGEPNKFLAVHETGRILLIDKSGTNEARSLFANVASDIYNKVGPNGLLCLAFHPRFRDNRRYFLKHSIFENDKIATTVVERTAAADFRTDSGEPSKRIWKVVDNTDYHGGGCIAFGPDGYLYIGMGDNGPQGDPEGHGQDLSTQLGKMLRIDVDNAENGLAYAIPRDNPFRDHAKSRPEIWAYGFREPWRFSFDPVTGDLWVGDVGQDRVEEVSVVRRGENYGWNIFEGFEAFSNQYRRTGENYISPVFAYRRKFGNSITGGVVYRGDKNSSFYGVYICGDYTSHRIFGLRQSDRVLQVVRQIGTAPQGIVTFGTDERGEIYAVGYEGMVYHLDFNGANFDERKTGQSSAP